MRATSVKRSESPAPEHAPATRLVIRVDLSSEHEVPAAPAPQRRRTAALPVVIGVVALAGLGWAGYRAFVADDVQQAPPPVEAAPPAAAEASAAPVVVLPAAEPATSGSTPVNEVLPDVSRNALGTIRGTVRVSVRVTVDRTGAVIAATPLERGPSRYFEQKSVDASRQWTFAPTAADEQRSMRLRFNFTRWGASASAEPLP